MIIIIVSVCIISFVLLTLAWYYDSYKASPYILIARVNNYGRFMLLEKVRDNVNDYKVEREIEDRGLIKMIIRLYGKNNYLFLEGLDNTNGIDSARLYSKTEDEI